jgi:hypothetical protein
LIIFINWKSTSATVDRLLGYKIMMLGNVRREEEEQRDRKKERQREREKEK